MLRLRTIALAFRTAIPLNTAEEPLTTEQQLVLNQRQVVALRLALDKSALQQHESALTADALRAQLADSRHAIQHKQSDLDAIAADMTRQYKSMRAELLNKCDQLEQQCMASNDALIAQRAAAAQQLQRTEQELAQAQAEVKDCHRRMHAMTIEFQEMLKSTLDKMAEKIQIQSSSSAAASSSGANANSSAQAREHSNSSGAFGSNAHAHSASAQRIAAQSAAHSHHSSGLEPVLTTFRDFSLVPHRDDQQSLALYR